MMLEKLPVRLSSESVLVVDDEEDVREMLFEALSTMGYDVQTAADGLEALDRLRESSFSVVVTDMNMPRMDGMELIAYLSKHRSEVAVVAITGYSMDYTKTEVVEAGACGYITKPFSLDDVEATLLRVIRDRRLVRKDPLTGLYNRRYFWEIVRQEVVRAGRYRYPLCLFFVDIDRFREYNNQNGHPQGDLLLKRFARVLQSSIREYVDGAFRWGGDEFVVLLPHLSRDHAMNVARRLQEKYNRLDLKPTSLSVGVAQFSRSGKDVDEDVRDLILRADNALLQKHHRSRNRVYFAEGPS